MLDICVAPLTMQATRHRLVPMNRVHFILYVADQKRSSDFYSAVLGRQPDLDVPGMTEFRLGDNSVLGLMTEDGVNRLFGGAIASPASAAGIPRCELYLLSEDADALHDRALEAGSREISPFAVRDWHHRVAYSLDPDGHVLAIATELP